MALRGAPGIWAAAGDTDGIDGTRTRPAPSSRPTRCTRAQAAGIDPRTCLDAHDSYSLFAAIGDLIRTGPTLTNVNDLRAILVA